LATFIEPVDPSLVASLPLLLTSNPEVKYEKNLDEILKIS
jgi:hypothetical protein